MNASSLNREIVLVTGGSSGIGAACCDLLSNNRTVYGASRTATQSDRWTYLKMDVTDAASVQEAVDSIVLRHGRIDGVVHCAGLSLTGSVEETGEAEALREFDTNYFGAVRVIQAVLPTMRRQRSGKIVVIGSIGGLIALPFQAHYSATKFALDGLVEALRNEVMPFNIYVSVLHPGNFKTALDQNRLRARNVAPDSPYHMASRQAAEFYADEEIGARSPVLVARKVEKILKLDRPQGRYVIGTPLELLGVLAKRILPSAIFEIAVRLLYFP